jgi:hypothetical protein
VSGFGDMVMWRHASNGTVCHHSLVADSLAPEGYYCVVGGIVRLDDGGPRTGKITVVLADDEPIEPPVERVFPQTPPPSRYLNDPPPPRKRHRAEAPGMFATWPEALTLIGMWAVFSGIIVGVLIGVVWGVLHLLS